MKKKSIIIVDDHEIFRKGLKLILNQMHGIEVVAEAADGKEFLNILNLFLPDIVFMDIRMPVMSGIEATKKALEKFSNLKIIAISMFGEEEYLEKMIKAGAKGFLLKNINKDLIKLAIEDIYQGKNYYSPELLPYFTQKFLSKDKMIKSNVKLTTREIEILRLVAQGFTSAEIAQKLYISKRTVDGHKSNILEKTDSKNVVTLLIYAIKNKLIKI